jgi:hypothetical protein
LRKGSTRSQWVENSVWKRLWTCRNAEYGMNETNRLTPLMKDFLRIYAPGYEDVWMRSHDAPHL